MPFSIRQLQNWANPGRLDLNLSNFLLPRSEILSTYYFTSMAKVGEYMSPAVLILPQKGKNPWLTQKILNTKLRAF